MLRSLLLPACAIALGLPQPGLAQRVDETAFPAAGSRVRVQPAGTAPRIVGVLRRIDAGQLFLAAPVDSTAIPLASIARLEVSRGYRVSAVGVALGVLGGAAAGFVVGCLSSRDDYGSICSSNNAVSTVTTTTLIGTAVGGVFGAYAGRRERWRLVPLGPPPPR